MEPSESKYSSVGGPEIIGRRKWKRLLDCLLYRPLRGTSSEHFRPLNIAFLGGPGSSRFVLLEDAFVQCGDYAVGLTRWPNGVFNPRRDNVCDSVAALERALDEALALHGKCVCIVPSLQEYCVGQCEDSVQALINLLRRKESANIVFLVSTTSREGIPVRLQPLFDVIEYLEPPSYEERKEFVEHYVQLSVFELSSPDVQTAIKDTVQQTVGKNFVEIEREVSSRFVTEPIMKMASITAWCKNADNQVRPVLNGAVPEGFTLDPSLTTLREISAAQLHAPPSLIGKRPIAPAAAPAAAEATALKAQRRGVSQHAPRGLGWIREGVLKKQLSHGVSIPHGRAKAYLEHLCTCSVLVWAEYVSLAYGSWEREEGSLEAVFKALRDCSSSASGKK